MQNLAFSTGVAVTRKTISSINKRIDYIFDIYNERLLIDYPYFSLISTDRFSKKPIAKASKNGAINWCFMLPHSSLSPICGSILFIPKLPKLASNERLPKLYLYILCIKINTEYIINSLNFSKVQRVFIRAIFREKIT